MHPSVHSSTVYNLWDKPKQPAWRASDGVVQTMLVIKHETLPFAATQRTERRDHTSPVRQRKTGAIYHLHKSKV